ncbi:MAG: hypothetical protein WC028_09210 [Candidatus Obscuribacterales bacterium]
MRRTQTFRYTFVYAFLAGFALTGSLAANADTQVTTTTTRSTSSNTSPLRSVTTYTLPTTSSYIVVDPITGVAQGSYNTVTHLVNGAPLSNGYVIVDESTRAMVAMVDQYGNIVDVAVAPANQTLLLSIDSRRKDLEAQIADAQAKGRLAAAQAELLRQELAVVTPYDSSSSSVVTYSRAIQMGSGLNSVSSRLIPITEKTYSNVIAPQFVTVDGHLTLADDLTFRKIQLTRRIEDEYAFGHITKDQLLQFKSDLTALSAREAGYRNGAAISTTGATMMTADLNSLQAKLNSAVVVR